MDNTKKAELINIFNCRYWQSGIMFARMLGDSLMQPCVHDSEFGEHSRESLKVIDAPVRFMIGINNALCFLVRDF